jgi:hypothetical protein
MSPIANDEHQEIATFLSTVMVLVVAWGALGKVRAGINISDRIKRRQRITASPMSQSC